MKLSEINITRDDFTTIPTVARKDVPPLSVFFFMTDIYYLNVGEHDGCYWSVCLNNETKGVMNYAVQNKYSKGGDNLVHVIGQITDLNFSDEKQGRLSAEETNFGDVIYLPDSLYPDSTDDYIPWLVLNSMDSGNQKMLFSIGTESYYGKLRKVSNAAKVFRAGVLSANLVRV